MPPRALTPIKRLLTAAPPRPAPIQTQTAPRQAQVLQSSRAPAQLSLFLRPSGVR